MNTSHRIAAQVAGHDTLARTLDTRGGHAWTAFAFALLSIALAGLAYPLATAVVGRALFPHQANGSPIVREGRVVGSALVAQPFADAKYLIGRPSAANHDGRALAGSNLAQSNPALRERVATDAAAIAAREGVAASAIPVDLVTTSGSGVDPHVSPAAAALQVPRIARARGLDEARVRDVIAAHTAAPTFGVLGAARVDVLGVNLALDALADDGTNRTPVPPASRGAR